MEAQRVPSSPACVSSINSTHSPRIQRSITLIAKGIEGSGSDVAHIPYRLLELPLDLLQVSYGLPNLRPNGTRGGRLAGWQCDEVGHYSGGCAKDGVRSYCGSTRIDPTNPTLGYR
jgi:hypothetical protein